LKEQDQSVPAGLGKTAQGCDPSVNGCWGQRSIVLGIPRHAAITHDHYDHLEKSTLVTINEKVERFIVPLGIGTLLEDWGIKPSKITDSLALGNL
jgi:hypothetical protein